MNSIVLSVSVITAISGVLALLLSVANRTIGDYGIKKLHINEDMELEVEAGDTLLSTLMSNDIFIPSACGGKGSCGYCKIQVPEGGGQILSTELGYVSEEEQNNHFRLACQCKVKEDLKLVIPKHLLNVKQYRYHVDSLVDMTPTIKQVNLSLPPEQALHFKPGQFIQIQTPAYKGSDTEVYRAYSVASSPLKSNHLELLIGYEPGGKCTTYVHQYLKPRDMLTVIGPYGDFYYHDGEKPMYLVAIGTGMAPILAIIRHMEAYGIERPATFFFGAKTKDDLFYMNELKSLEEKMPYFRFIPCLSRCEEGDDWEGEKGRVTDLIERYIENAQDAEGYLCGSPVMIDSVVKLLISKGMPVESIYYDKFE